MSNQYTPEPGISGQELLDRLAKLDPESAERAEAIRTARGTIGAQLHVGRMNSKLDAQELADRAGVDLDVVIGIEHGTHEATRRELELLGTALDIDFAIGKTSAA
jgi:transcriptional regulator with XRE-family HTH domain